MRGINTKKSKKLKQQKKDKEYQTKFYVILAAVTLVLFLLVYLVYSRM